MGLSAHFPENGTFDPEAIEAMSKAFGEACNALRIFAGDVRGRETIAARVIDLARDGIIDPSTVVERILSESMAVA
jgi:hypothetical protein